MRRLLPLCAVLVVLPQLGSDSPPEYDDRTQMANLEGTWQLVKIKRGDQDGQDPAWELVIRSGGKYSWVLGGQAHVDGTCKVNLGPMPAQIDFSPGIEPAKNHRGIFRFDGDILVIAMFEPEEVRPRSFSEKGLKLLTLKRVKK